MECVKLAVVCERPGSEQQREWNQQQEWNQPEQQRESWMMVVVVLVGWEVRLSV